MRVLRTSLTLVALAAIAGSASAEKLDHLLPEDTILFVHLNDVTNLQAKLKDSPLAALWQEEELQKFLELPRQTITERMKDHGVSLEQILGILQGEAAVAITGLRRVDDSKQILGCALLIEVGESEAKAQELIDRLEENEEAMAGVRRMVTEARGAKIVSYLPKDGDGLRSIDDDIYTGAPCYVLQDGLLVAGNDVEVLKNVLARRAADDVPSLASHEVYRDVREQTGVRADFTAYVNAQPLWAMLEARSEDNPMIARVVGALGLTSIRGFGYAVELNRDAMLTRMFLDAPGEKRGLLRLFAGANTELVPPSFVPANAATVMTMTLDFADLWAETRRVIARIDESMLPGLDASFAGLKEQTGVDIEKDVIGSLGKQATFYQIIPDEMAEGGMAMMVPNYVLALKVDDADTFGVALDTLIEMFPIPLSEEEYLGVRMHVMREGLPAAPAMALVGGHLVVAAHLEDLQAVIRSAGKDVKGLVGSPAFERAMSRLPASRLGVSFSNPEPAYQAFAGMLPNIPMGPGVAEWIDLSLLPSWEIFGAYFDPAGGVTISNERGVLVLGHQGLKAPK